MPKGTKPSRALCDFPLDALLLPRRPDHQKLARPDAANDPASLDFGCIRVERARIVDRVIVGRLALIDLVECDGAAASAAGERRIERAAGETARAQGSWVEPESAPLLSISAATNEADSPFG